jgi:hypothetical protein
MKKKTQRSAELIGHFILTNVFLPLVMYQLGKDLYEVWFK